MTDLNSATDKELEDEMAARRFAATLSKREEARDTTQAFIDGHAGLSASGAVASIDEVDEQYVTVTLGNGAVQRYRRDKAIAKLTELAVVL
tara:strand:+ start:158 stop:430 length:273 start_codon:yes stop_codon:yes gene_type:complete